MPNYNFTTNVHPSVVVKEYIYQGVLISRRSSFLAMKKKYIAIQAKKALFCLLKKARSQLLPIDTQLQLIN